MDGTERADESGACPKIEHFITTVKTHLQMAGDVFSRQSLHVH